MGRAAGIPRVGTSSLTVSRLVKALALVWTPVPLEKKDLLRRRWKALDPRWRQPLQGLGQKATGCGATIGLHPRCDFDCTGCYLADGANRSRPLKLDQIYRQLDDLRLHLGPKGNVQITDGEVTLRPLHELIAVVRRARSLGLIPMVMTHGDTFRRRPGLLTTLVEQGGLTEVAIHIDTTQRGRMGYRDARNEADLMPLREEFAAMIRQVRQTTGRSLRAATTMTITRHNLDGVGAVVEWCLHNRDVFGFLSCQPLARVGRTRENVEGVSREELWQRIDRTLAPYGGESTPARSFLFGHPACTRTALAAVYQRSGHAPQVVPVLRDHSAEDEALVRAFFATGLAGINFRDDSALERVGRALGALLHAPTFAGGPLRRWFAARAAGLGTTLPGLAVNLLRGRLRVDGLVVTSHHFMGRAEVETAVGKERLAACVFRVPVNGRMVSMCEVNLLGAREAIYEQAAPVTSRPQPRPRRSGAPGARCSSPPQRVADAARQRVQSPRVLPTTGLPEARRE